MKWSPGAGSGERVLRPLGPAERTSPSHATDSARCGGATFLG